VRRRRLYADRAIERKGFLARASVSKGRSS
jgi:hypothetical protein